MASRITVGYSKHTHGECDTNLKRIHPDKKNVYFLELHNSAWGNDLYTHYTQVKCIWPLIHSPMKHRTIILDKSQSQQWYMGRTEVLQVPQAEAALPSRGKCVYLSACKNAFQIGDCRVPNAHYKAHSAFQLRTWPTTYWPLAGPVPANPLLTSYLPTRIVFSDKLPVTIANRLHTEHVCDQTCTSKWPISLPTSSRMDSNGFHIVQ